MRASGRYDAQHQVLVVDRRLDDRVGAWVLTPLVVESTGARLAVVRGFVDDGAAAPPVPTGRVTVHGTLQPQEGLPETFEPQPPGRWQTVDLATGVNLWGGDIYNGFVFASREDPPATGASAQVTPVPPPTVGGEGINWRNAAYAVQWWIFAGFALYIWWRSVRDDHEARLAARGADTGVPGAGPQPVPVDAVGPDSHVSPESAAAPPVDPSTTPSGGASR